MDDARVTVPKRRSFVAYTIEDMKSCIAEDMKRERQRNPGHGFLLPAGFLATTVSSANDLQRPTTTNPSTAPPRSAPVEEGGERPTNS